MPKNYQITYFKEDYQILESFNKDLNYYQFLVKYDDQIFPLIVPGNYLVRRQLVDEIKLVQNNQHVCLVLQIEKGIYPVCYQGEELVSFHLISNRLKEQLGFNFKTFSSNVTDNHKNLRIYNLLDNHYYIWNYKEYFYISDKQKQNIPLLKEDNYNNVLAYKINHYLITPNYDRRFAFDEFLIIDTRRVELSSMKFEEEIEISYDSYYLGYDQDDLYLVDRRNRLQYKINIRRNKLSIIGSLEENGVWYNNGWENISLTRLINQDYIFKRDQIHNFILEDERLYYQINEYKILLSNQNVKTIVDIIDNEVYYLVGNILYMYSDRTGEVKLVENSEWSFNYQNTIFIFKDN